ncbi:putative oxidoreductase fad-binding domain-containing protein [Phaeoacremonium minimum UCRPA7]|uniref:Putative oxidoreductase fad-binding domain-containing protein n=1 Tax=Phaeoacremonium minimum (strain UCR-PA7) TaxID=1286976 RepID=R8BKQ0_PHAM7|nr:putative oxidoreductase fad-binding domain-containing protein [Phaeoacremonium minimum UCRPA7]EON99787.1 putative oxidoreductase fad-binding domain-containing protein [Phaeoacremonium minimum UCRPA7]
MPTLHEHVPGGWHEGEQFMHRLLHSSRQGNPTSYGLPAHYAYRVQVSALVAFGTLDSQGRPWTTVWGGERGFARAIAQNVLGVQTLVDRRFDPVVEAFFGGKEDGEMVRPLREGDDAQVMAGLSIDLSTRDRVKLAGRMIAGAVQVNGSEETTSGDEKERKEEQKGAAEVQLAMMVQESLGNCPKYLNKKEIRPHVPSPSLVSDTLPLPMEAMKLLARADLFFLSSTSGETMDTNHRGGPPGFVRVVSNSASDGVVLVYPEYSGNQLYQTLGNLHVRPLVGLVVPDFASGDALYLTGETSVLVGRDAAALLPHSKLAVKITVTAARFVRDSLPFRGDVVDYSPYNPPVRRLASEQAALVAPSAEAASGPPATATLVKREVLTPSIARFTFKLRPSRPGALKQWKPGQHITLDFSEELDMGWSHMRDDDPKSLNDDFVRTFTVSNAPGVGADVRDGAELEITARKNGPATALLWRHNLRVPLELPVFGFGGEEAFRLPTGSTKDGKEAVFIAGGVGITPVLAQASGIVEGGSPLTVLWSLRAEDLPLAVDTFKRLPGLAGRVRLFVTGRIEEKGHQASESLEAMGATIVKRRILKTDVIEGSGKRRKYYLCTAPEMLKVLTSWLEGEEVIWESFEY